MSALSALPVIGHLAIISLMEIKNRLHIPMVECFIFSDIRIQTGHLFH